MKFSAQARAVAFSTFLGGICLASYSEAQSAEVWREAEINAYIDTYSAFAKRLNIDPFSALATPAPAPKVLIEYPVKALVGRKAEIAPEKSVESFFTYDATQEILTVDLISARFFAPLNDYWREIGDYSSNDYAEEAWLTKFSRTEDVVDFFDPKKKTRFYQQKYGIAEWVDFSSPDPSGEELNRYGQRVYRYEVSASPEEARKLAANLSFRVYARTKPWKDGEWIVCSVKWKLEGPPNRKPDGPDRYYFHDCLLTVEVETIELVDLNTGDTLKSWRGRFKSRISNQRIKQE